MKHHQPGQPRSERDAAFLERFDTRMRVPIIASAMFQRLGRVVAVALGVVVLGSLVAYYTEHPVNPQFATVGDALWWGLATLTTVGYGDVVPQTSTGRWAAAVIMITGIAVLGILAGALGGVMVPVPWLRMTQTPPLHAGDAVWATVSLAPHPVRRR
jgi:Ion channel